MRATNQFKRRCNLLVTNVTCIGLSTSAIQSLDKYCRIKFSSVLFLIQAISGKSVNLGRYQKSGVLPSTVYLGRGLFSLGKERGMPIKIRMALHFPFDLTISGNLPLKYWLLLPKEAL